MLGSGGRSQLVSREHNVVALVMFASMMSMMADTFTFEAEFSFGIVTQQSAVGSAQDLKSLQLFLPHLKHDI